MAPAHDDGPPLVRAEGRGPARVLPLDSPHDRDALSARLVAELAAGVRAAGADRTIGAVVLTGAGSVLCLASTCRSGCSASSPQAAGGPPQVTHR